MSDISEMPIPQNSDEKRKSERFLPAIFRSQSNKKFLSSTTDQLIQSGTVKRLNGFIGRQNAKAATGEDVYLSAPLADRQNYQLEPSLVIEDDLNNVTFFKDYIDYINTLNVLGGIPDNHQRLNQQEYYTWQPHIDWDKFVNFLQYYWMPFGPETIPVIGAKQLNTVSTFSVQLVDEGDNFAFLFSPDGLTRNPDLRLYRGETYRFEINTPNNPFSIKTERVFKQAFRYTDGVSASAVSDGVIEFTVPLDAPDILYYVSEANGDTAGVIKIFNIEENSVIDVEEEIVGKKYYKLSNGFDLSNGMKIRFKGLVTPEKYRDMDFYVEGVGQAIQLIAENTLEVVSTYANYLDVNFDSLGFDQLPFNNVNYAALTKDYITINKASRDRNHWSRYNRWTHQDVIIKTAEILGKAPVFDQSLRALRPIIEFDANLRLFNFGTYSKKNIDLVDDYTQDVFSIIEGSLGYNIDGVDLLHGHRVLFLADKDVLVRNKIFKVEFLNIYDEQTGKQQRRIHLAEENDSDPLLDQCVLVLGGNNYLGEMFWFDGTNWIKTQSKNTVNQAPLFDLYDEEGVNLRDTNKYEGSTFKGTSIFSYKEGKSTKDKELGFGLSYKNINNVGDIVFNFTLLTDTFNYKLVTQVIEDTTCNKFLKKYNSVGEEYFANGWEHAAKIDVQPIVRIYRNDTTEKFVNGKLISQPLVNDFPIDVYNDKDDLEDLHVKVYINGKRLSKNLYSVVDSVEFKLIRLENDITESDVVTLRCSARQVKNSKGYYEFPINFQNNSQNNNLTDFTLGEVIDHVDSIVDNLPNFVGIYPGISNLRDCSNLSAYGTKFVQHTGSLNLSLYHLTDKNANVIKAIDKSKDDYGKFKRAFAYQFDQLESDLIPRDAVDLILVRLNEGRSKLSSYYFSDMLAYGANTKKTFKVKDIKSTLYPLLSIFNLKELTPKSTYIYLNQVQLLHERDYVFTDQGFVKILCEINEDDIIDVYEYDSTDACFIPATPTSLGLYPKFEPKKYLDTTLLDPVNVIQGHDGSIMLAYNDFRDDIILELECRIFNNIKINYNPKVFDIYNFIPSANRPTAYTLEEFNKILAPNFFNWSKLVDTDFTKQPIYLRNNPFTFNFTDIFSIDNNNLLGYWRGIYKWYYDTDRIHICPWESLGFSIEPKWWQEVYGPPPYTSNNLILWKDLRDGIIREPNKVALSNPKFVRPILDLIPVDSQGKLLDPIASNLAAGPFNTDTEKNYVFGDQGPVETAWRRSSYYPFSLIKTFILMQPNTVLGLLFDRSRIVRDLTGKFVYKPTNLRLRLQDFLTTSVASDSERIQTSGLINYVIDYLVRDNLYNLNLYKSNLKNLNNKLSHRLGGYTSKEKYELIIDSKSASASSGVFIPKENYKIFLNTSSPIKHLNYSGIVITKLLTKQGQGFEIKGYNQSNPYFNYYTWTKIGYDINVGGISESYIVWDRDQRYIAGNVVKIEQDYFRVKVGHTSSSSPSYDLLQKLPALPIVGGSTANIRSEFDRVPLTLNYGTILKDHQEVVDFLLGYGEYLKDQGFEFDNYNQTLQAITNWEYSVREFLFWTTQNWSSGVDSYTEWNSSTQYKANDVVYYDNSFYRCIMDHISEEEFDINYFYRIEELNSDGAAAISLSPSALKLDLKLSYSVVDDLKEVSNDYEIFLADGTKYNFDQLSYLRYDDTFTLQPKNTVQGIYGAGLFLIQKEHVLILDNTTQFNDTIYNIETGYRQERIRVSGYKTINWNGSFDAPGFIYDQAKIKEWSPWTDYNLGDIVKYKEYYYSATKSIVGEENFDSDYWIRLKQKPDSQLLPNWDYKALQFTDFYDLDSSNFDVDQQRIAQHLIGYQKRDYLENIIKNDVSEFKFYQGMIAEKGTINSLNKLFDVLSEADQDSLDFVEEWAVRAGQYGSNQAFEEVEFILDENLFKLNPQVFELVTEIDTNKIDYVIRQTKNDIYVKPKNYTNNIWPVNKNYDPLLKTPGFVRLDQVKYAIDKRLDICNLDINTLVSGDYIWCGFEAKINQFGDDWSVYRFNHLDIHVTDTETVGNFLKVGLDTNPFSVGDIIGFNSSSVELAGLFEITGVDANKVTIKKPNKLPKPTDDLSVIRVYNISEQRSTNIDNLEVPSFLNPKTVDWNYGELAWFSDTKDEIWQNIPIYDYTTFTDSVLVENSKFSTKLATDKLGTIIVSATDDNRVFVYKRFDQLKNYIKIQILKPQNSSITTNFGKTLALSQDAKFLAIACNESYNSIQIYQQELNGSYSYKATLTNSGSTDDFGSKIKFAKRNNTYYMYVGNNLDINQTGSILIFKLSTSWTLEQTITNTQDISFGYEFDVTDDGSLLVTSSSLVDGGIVYLYKFEFGAYILQSQLLDLPNDNSENFGFSLSLSSNGTKLAVSSYKEDSNFVDQGLVRIYITNVIAEDSTQVQYTLSQTLSNRNAKQNEQFGYKVLFTNNDKTLLVYSKFGDSSKTPNIGEDSSVINFNSGRIDIYDQYLTKYVFSESLSVENGLEDYANEIVVSDNSIVVGAPSSSSNKGKFYLYTKPKNKFTWRKLYEETDKVDIECFKKIFLYNRKTNNLVNYVDIVDPIQGKIPGVAEQEISYKTYYDPATYSNLGVGVNLNKDEGMCWQDKQVGKLWWNLTRAKFIDPSLGDIVYKNTVWNVLYPTASVDVYEWVESKYTPDQWDELSQTEAGFTEGISGTSLYGNKAYSTKLTFDSISKSYKTTYYFWVKDKKIIPAAGRTKSSIDTANIIASPKSYNICYVSFVDFNGFGLANVNNLVSDRDLVLSVQYWTISNKQKRNIHNEWKIISETDKTEIPKHIENKWVDSLVGFDEQGSMIPDITLSPKQQFGIENRPKQSMFFNRIEALKQVIERFNSEIKQIQIDNVDISGLFQKDEMPTSISGQYDIVKDSDLELEYVNTSNFRTAKIEPIINYGKILDINIIDPGMGYVNTPKVKIIGQGQLAEIKLIVTNGSITKAEILNPGMGYDDVNTLLVVRPFTVLVKSDSSTFGAWALYTYDSTKNKWQKEKTQEYDTTRFWDYIDWYADGYDQYTKVDYIITGINELFLLEANLGQIVKVKNIGSSNEWLLLRKYADLNTIDYTKNYKVIGRQNGTIQITSRFYSTNTNSGFDRPLFDSLNYDNSGTKELRIILNALKDKILIDDRRIIYINLFFVSLRYVLYEQPFVDWVFKTSFVKAFHNVGKLKQKVTYRNDNLSDFEKYIKEVKPYRTKIREFISIYNNVDNSQSMVTDFDLPSYISNYKIKSLDTRYSQNTISVNDNEIIKEFPWSSWYDNVGFSVKEVVITEQGSGYFDRPVITFEGICIKPARGVPYIVRGKLIKIDIVDAGQGYFSPPRVIIDGNYDVDGKGAVAYSTLGNNLIRTNSVAIKFDRFSKEIIKDVEFGIDINQSFVGDGSTTQFTLNWSASTEKSTTKVTVNNEEIIIGNYSVSESYTTDRGHRVYSSTVTFNQAPEAGSNIIVYYRKHHRHLNALERIDKFYSPESGMIGKDFTQLMTGIDYGGVNVLGLGFEQANSWDGEYGWGERPWDQPEPTDYEKYDSLIEGGNLNPTSSYRTASGLRADDIILDGDNFVTPNTSPAPEEMVPGHVADCLAIKVVERKTAASSEIITNVYISDGITTNYKISQYPNNKNAVIVKLDDVILVDSVDYTFNYDNLTVELVDIPDVDKIISITSLGFNGENIVLLDKFVVKEETSEIITDLRWQDNLKIFTVVSGTVKNSILFKTDSSYSQANLVGIRFPFTLQVSQIVNYTIFEGDEINQSIVNREIIQSTGATTYKLSYPVGKKLPFDSNVIVRVDDFILNSVESFKFTMKNNQTIYDIPAGKADIDLYSLNDYVVYIDNIKVNLNDAYTLDLLAYTITIKPAYYKTNSEVLVTITKNAEYSITKENNDYYINFKDVYALGIEIEVISMYNHDILDIERDYFKIEPDLTKFKDSVYYLQLTLIGSGILKLDREVLNSSYVWVIKNRKLLTPSIDYVLMEDRKNVRLNFEPKLEDRFTVITFSGNINRNPISFIQFKDIFNRFTYKRINKNRTTYLANPLLASDKEIIISDSSKIGDGNKVTNEPGVIYINGERIEYFVKINNKLTQLRRGTLGTGVPNVHAKGTQVFDIGPSETIPYNDETLIFDRSRYSESSNTMVVPFLPSKNSVEVFVGGKRLKKDGYTLHNKWIHPESPEGDEDYPAEFTTDGINHGDSFNKIGYIVLAEAPQNSSTSINVVTKRLRPWADQGKSLSDSDNAIAYFLKFPVEPYSGTQSTTDSNFYSTDSDDISVDEE